MWLGDFGVNLLVTETVVDIVGFPVHSLHLFCEGSASPYAAFVNISPNPPPRDGSALGETGERDGLTVKACTQRPESLRPALR